jgi:hypothetical protein
MNLFNKKIIFIINLIICYPLATNALTINPQSISLKPGATQIFSVTGNTEKLHWLSINGKLNILKDGTSAEYTAPQEAGIDSIAVTDNHSVAVADIKVYKTAILAIEILGGNQVLTVGAQQSLLLQAWLSDKTQRNYTEAAVWKTSDASIVEVNNGVITANVAGKATISATIEDKTTQIEVEVKEQQSIGLAVQPSPIYLNINTKQQLKIFKILKNGELKAQDSATCNFKSNNQIIQVNKEQVHAISQGYAIIEVTCDNLHASVPVFISSPLALEAFPIQFSLGIGTFKAFKISGGSPPYIVTAETGRVNGNSEKWYYHAARSTGNDIINVTDQEGTEISLNVTITQGLTLSPQAVNLLANSQTEFNVSGGIAPYRWQISNGQLDNSQAAKVTYTAPDASGVYEISVFDNTGQVKRAIINVGDKLIATPNEFILNNNEEQRFYIIGGEPPYKISTTAGTYQQENEIYYYQAPSVDGNYSINIIDSEARNAEIKVIVQSKLLVTPNELFLKLEQQATLNISGGYGKYKITAKTGDISQETNGKFTYKAANTAGRDVITITDQAATVEQVEVLVSRNGFYSSPGKSYILPNEKVKLRALGGTPPYSWTIKGEGDLSKNEGDRVTFTAPKVAGNYTVVVKDNSGETTESTVVVYQGELQFTPESLILAPGKQADLQVLLGVPNYTWSAQFGKLSNTEGKIVTYTAPITETEDIIQVEDASGTVKNLRVFINNKTSIPCIYAGSDCKVDENEMNKALNDFFQQQGWISRTELFVITEMFLGE